MALAVVALAASPAAAAAAPGDVGGFTSSGLGPVNTWWIETPNRGLVVVDAQRDARSAAAAIAAIRRARHPVRAILVTHPHPDHVTGLAAFKRAFPQAQVIAQAATRDEFVRDTQRLLSAGGAPPPPAPDRVVDDERFTIDGIVIEARAMGAGESVAQTVYFLPAQRLLFSGDLATPTLTPFLAEGRTRAWLQQLAALTQRFPADARVRPGHGPGARLGAIVAGQRGYLTGYRRRVAEAMRANGPGGATVTPAERAAVTRDMRRSFPTQGQVAGLAPAELDRLNVEAVARELAAEGR